MVKVNWLLPDGLMDSLSHLALTVGLDSIFRKLAIIVAVIPNLNIMCALLD